jgi:ABC-type lipoprotein release transport system permease subunit
MSIAGLVVKEIRYRKLNFALGLLAVVIATGCFAGAVTLLQVHDLRTRQLLTAKETETRTRLDELSDAVRKAMLRLGFNIVILPKRQQLEDWYAHDFATNDMPEAFVEKLAQSKIVTIQHLLPSLQQRVLWPETKRTIILVGTRGEVPNRFSTPKQPLAQPVPAGHIVLGHELHTSLGLKVGDRLKLLGREFTVHQAHAARGSKDDITAWIPLAEAQALLNKPGRINAILALECNCAMADVAKVREEIGRILPETQVIERGSEALARAEARRRVEQEAADALQAAADQRGRLRAEREHLAAWLVPAVLLVCAAAVALLMLANVRERRGEIGILRAIGLRQSQVLALFLSKALLIGLAGGVAGWLAGFWIGHQAGSSLESGAGERIPAVAVFEPRWLLLTVLLAPVLAALASWMPALLAARQDPAVTLQEG